MNKLITIGLLSIVIFSPIKGFAAELPSTFEAVDLYKEIYYPIPVNNFEKLSSTSKENTNSNITDDDVYLMAQIVFAESRSEPFEGKVAVASVILNRLRHSEFPKTVREVVTQKYAFSCVINGKIDVVPDESSYTAVREALKGTDPTSKAVFFYNPRTATSKWMKNINKNNKKTIGNHVFFVVNNTQT